MLRGVMVRVGGIVAFSLLLTAAPARAQNSDIFREDAPPAPAPAPRPAPRPRPYPPPEPEAVAPAVVPAPALPPSPSYDGTYTGEATVSTNSSGKCFFASLSKTLTVKNDQFTYAFSETDHTVVTGTVGRDGTVNSFAPSPGGGVHLSGKIQGSAFTGQAVSASSYGFSCVVDFRFQKMGR